MRNTVAGKHTAKQLRNFNGSCTNQYRTAFFDQRFNFSNNSIKLFAFGFINKILVIGANYRAVGRNNHHIQFINIPELTRFGFGSTCHTGKFAVHTEIILQCYSSISLSSSFNLYIFLSFDRLMQSIAVSAAFENTTGLLIHNLHLVIHHHIFHIYFEQGICFKQLIYSMDAFGFHGIIAKELCLLISFLFIRYLAAFHFGYFSAYIRKYIKFRIIVRFGNQIDAFISKFNGIIFFVDNKIQLIIHNVHVFRLFLHVEIFGFKQNCLDTGFAEEFNQRLVFW